MQVDIWSDVVCPWCYIGKRRFEAALREFEHADEVQIVWRSYELNPNAPATREGDYITRIARKYGIPADQAALRVDRLVTEGREEGLDLRFDQMRAGNSFNAHRLLHLAAGRGMQDAVKERFFRATFTEGAAIGDPDVLGPLAVEAGLDEADVTKVLDTHEYIDEVRADEAEAMQLEITGVPFFRIGGRIGVPGAQSPETFLAMLNRAWAKLHA